MLPGARNAGPAVPPYTKKGQLYFSHFTKIFDFLIFKFLPHRDCSGIVNREGRDSFTPRRETTPRQAGINPSTTPPTVGAGLVPAHIVPAYKAEINSATTLICTSTPPRAVLVPAHIVPTHEAGINPATTLICRGGSCTRPNFESQTMSNQAQNPKQ